MHQVHVRQVPLWPLGCFPVNQRRRWGWWIGNELDGQRLVRIEEAGALIFARLNTMIDGFGGAYVEAHALDAKRAKKIPKAMIGRVLTAREARALLARLT